MRLEGSRCQTTPSTVLNQNKYMKGGSGIPILCMYSGTSLIRTSLGPSFSGGIIEVSSFQGLLM